MDKSFFVDGNFVFLGCLEELVSNSNSDKTIKEFLKEKTKTGDGFSSSDELS